MQSTVKLLSRTNMHQCTKGIADVKITIQISIVYAILLFPGALQVSYNLHLTINTSGLLLDRTH